MNHPAEDTILPQKVRILHTDISITSYQQVCGILDRFGRAHARGYVCICNVHTLMEAHDNPEYAAILNRALIATPDGMPLVWALRRMGFPCQTRVYGPDLLLAFAAYASRRPDLTSYFFGAGPGVADTLAKSLSCRFPGFMVAGCHSPRFGRMSREEDAACVDAINASGAHVLWVGLGAPQQERWMAEHAAQINAIMVGVGAAFDFLSGAKPQAPRWMMRLGLEWLYRLGTEPRRLWRRYLVHNPRFLWKMRALMLKNWPGSNPGYR